MNLRRFAYFIAVGESLHFRKAAEQLAVAQPALSAQIAKLEAELGLKLLVRDRKHVRLTEAGASLMVSLKHIMPQLKEAVSQARSIQNGLHARIAIGCVGSAAFSFLPRALAMARADKRVGTAQIELRQLTTEQQVQALHGHQIDIGIMRSPPLMRALMAVKLLEEPFVVAVPRNHELAGTKAINGRMLSSQSLITVPADAGALRNAIIAQCVDLNATPRIIDEMTEMSTIVGLVAAGRGLALVPHSVSDIQMKGVVFKKLSRPSRVAELWLVRRICEERSIVQSVCRVLGSAGKNLVQARQR